MNKLVIHQTTGNQKRNEKNVIKAYESGKIDNVKVYVVVSGRNIRRVSKNMKKDISIQFFDFSSRQDMRGIRMVGHLNPGISGTTLKTFDGDRIKKKETFKKFWNHDRGSFIDVLKLVESKYAEHPNIKHIPILESAWQGQKNEDVLEEILEKD